MVAVEKHENVHALLQKLVAFIPSFALLAEDLQECFWSILHNSFLLFVSLHIWLSQRSRPLHERRGAEPLVFSLFISITKKGRLIYFYYRAVGLGLLLVGSEYVD